ncbi:MAG: class II fumarate hydratase [Gammaproteobacteria bacterium]|nr:class II fumarate hydratase [Gammaproteobacteria bacterium]
MNGGDRYRLERDSFGEVKILEECLWGRQTQRSLSYFAIGDDRLSKDAIYAFALIKKAAAIANHKLGVLEEQHKNLIVNACDAILRGEHGDQFPVSIWQTGSGTQSNMNLNEVIANLANLEVGAPAGSYMPVHPNDHVNRSQSSNDVFPTVMHLVATSMLSKQLLPALGALIQIVADKEMEFRHTIKCGRTHMMDATPVTLGQEFGGFKAQLEFSLERISGAIESMREVALGGTAVGTGFTAPPDWTETVTAEINRLVDFEFSSKGNKFALLAGHEALLHAQQQLNLLATTLMKIGNDVRLMGSGPRCGLAEIILPANEPGSSIMPGKINPTQVEALTMVCCRVMGNTTTVSVAASQGQFQLNVYKPVILHCITESISLLSDAMASFSKHCLKGIQVNSARLRSYTEQSLMLVTALSPHIGYDKAGKAAKLAYEKSITLREAVLELKLLDAEQFDDLVKPEAMLGISD